MFGALLQDTIAAMQAEPGRFIVLIGLAVITAVALVSAFVMMRESKITRDRNTVEMENARMVEAVSFISEFLVFASILAGGIFKAEMLFHGAFILIVLCYAAFTVFRIIVMRAVFRKGRETYEMQQEINSVVGMAQMSRGKKG